MGLDLTLLPFDADSGDWAFSHTVLETGRHYVLFDWIKKLPQMKVPKTFTSHVSRQSKCDKCDEPHYGITTETPYGDAVMYVMIDDLIKIPAEVKATFSVRTKAIWAYLGEFDRQTKVALFWH